MTNENDKLWKLIDKLEKENSLLLKANKNNLDEINRLQDQDISKDYVKQINDLLNKNKKLELQIKNLRKVLAAQYGLSPRIIDKMINEINKNKRQNPN